MKSVGGRFSPRRPRRVCRLSTRPAARRSRKDPRSRSEYPSAPSGRTHRCASRISLSPTSTFTIGLASSPGTAVLPTRSMISAHAPMPASTRPARARRVAANADRTRLRRRVRPPRRVSSVRAVAASRTVESGGYRPSPEGSNLLRPRCRRLAHDRVHCRHRRLRSAAASDLRASPVACPGPGPAVQVRC